MSYSSKHSQFSDIILPQNSHATYNVTVRRFLSNYPVLPRFVPIKFASSYLGPHPITCQFLVKNLHFIIYSARTRQSLDRQQQNKGAHFVMLTRKPLNRILSSLFKYYHLFQEQRRKKILVRSYWR